MKGVVIMKRTWIIMLVVAQAVLNAIGNAISPRKKG
jgi:hypothetical protein